MRTSVFDIRAGIAAVSIALRRLRPRLSSLEMHRDYLVIRARMLELETETRRAQARLHEITSIVTGIASAAQLIPTLQPSQRGRLESAVKAEMGRLTRLLHDESDDLRPIEIDEIVEHLVTAHSARGRTVIWTPSGLRAIGRSDEVAEAINVLLENAARHGSPDDIRIEITGTKNRIRIAVSDRGPGIRPELSELIFAWGARRADSPGQGIGLYVARQQMRAVGGDLDLIRHPGPGARFLITLPATPDKSRKVCDSLALAG